MCSKFITPRVRLFISTLNKLIKDLKANISDEAREYIDTPCAEAGSHAIHKKKSNYQLEEDFYIKCKISPFKRHFSEIYQVQLASIENDVSDVCQINSLYLPLFFETILSNLFPIILLWSGLLLGNLSPHGESSSYVDYASHRIKYPSVKNGFNENFEASNGTTGISEISMGDLYNNLLGRKQAARLDDIVSLLYENVHGMQKMFTDTVTSALIEKDKTKWVIQEEWSKKRSKSFKSLNYQQGLNRDNTIIIKQNKETKDDHVRPRTEEKELRMSKEQAKQTTKNQKHQKNVES